MVSSIGLDSDEYISKKPLLSLEEAQKRALRIQIYLSGLYKTSRIVGYSTRVLKNDVDIEYEDLDPEILNEENGTRFPSIWVNVTYNYGEREALELELHNFTQDFDLEST
jgi:hypothetical protein